MRTGVAWSTTAGYVDCIYTERPVVGTLTIVTDLAVIGSTRQMLTIVVVRAWIAACVVARTLSSSAFMTPSAHAVGISSTCSPAVVIRRRLVADACAVCGVWVYVAIAACWGVGAIGAVCTTFVALRTAPMQRLEGEMIQADFDPSMHI